MRKYVKIHVVALTCILYNVKSWVEIDRKYAMLIGQNVVVIMSSVDLIMVKQKSKLKQQGFWSLLDNDNCLPLSAQCNVLMMTKFYVFLSFLYAYLFVQHIICLILSNAWLTINISVCHDRGLWVVVYSVLVHCTVSQQTIQVQSKS